MTDRMVFISALREKIVADLTPQANALGFTASAIHRAITRWEKEEEPKGPLDKAVFKVCDHVQAEVEAT